MIRPGCVLLLLSEARKLKLFEKDVEASDGSFFKLFTQIRAERGTDQYLDQSVMIAEVVNFADDIKWLKKGDIVIIDYMVDQLDYEIVERDGPDKILILELATTFHESDRVAYASIHTRQDTYTWRKGDVDENSLIYAIYRDGELIPNPPFIICEQKDFTVEKETASGLIYTAEEADTVVRKIISAPASSQFKAGDFVIIERYCLYGRSVEGVNFDIIMEQDVMALLES